MCAWAFIQFTHITSRVGSVRLRECAVMFSIAAWNDEDAFSTPLAPTSPNDLAMGEEWLREAVLYDTS